MLLRLTADWLAQAADVGIALSGGMDAAAQAASIVLMGDRLGQTLEVHPTCQQSQQPVIRPHLRQLLPRDAAP